MGRTSDARQRLMDAANSLICEYSYGAVTIDAICERAAVKKGSFYYFFDSKSDLAVAAIDAWWHTRERVIEKIFAAEGPAVERLRRYLDFVTEVQLNAYSTSGQVLGCPLFTLGAEICLQDERIRARIMEFLGAVLDVFARTIAEAQRAGDLPAGDPRTIARTLLSVYEGILTLARIEHDPERVRHLTHDALTAVGVREASQPALAGAPPEGVVLDAFFPR
jgi:TetR/AcrR family transcriptional regulator, transcriptional repressor for nem operon